MPTNRTNVMARNRTTIVASIMAAPRAFRRARRVRRPTISMEDVFTGPIRVAVLHVDVRLKLSLERLAPRLTEGARELVDEIAHDGAIHEVAQEELEQVAYVVQAVHAAEPRSPAELIHRE